MGGVGIERAAAGPAGGSRRASIDLASLNRIRGALALADRGNDVGEFQQDLPPKLGRDHLTLLEGDRYLAPLNGGYNVVQKSRGSEEGSSLSKPSLGRDAAGSGDVDSGGGINQRKKPLRRSVSSANRMPRSLALSGT